MDALRRSGRAMLALALARAEFASVELTRSAQAALGWLLMALGACVLAMLGLIALSATVVIALWDRFGWYPLGLLALIYCTLTAALVARLVRALSDAPPLLVETFAELAKDGAALRAASTAPAVNDE